MDADAEAHIATLRKQREVAQGQRAAMEEVQSETRQALLEMGADEYVLRQFELGAIDLAINDVTLRNMDRQIENVERMAG
jgi:DNA-binding response OmpR family regulator